MEETKQSHWRPCAKCGRRSVQEFCSACRTSNGRGRMKPTTDRPYHKREKATSSSSLINFVDIKPIAGVGESLIELEKKLEAIDNEFESHRVELEHINDMHL